MLQRQNRYVWPLVAFSSLLALLLLEVAGVLDTALSVESYRQALSSPFLEVLHSLEDDSNVISLPSDPYNAPGRLVFNPSEPLEADWVPFDPSFPPPVNWLRVVKDAMSATNSAPPSPPMQDGLGSPSKIFGSAGKGPRRHSRLFKTHRNSHQHGHAASAPPADAHALSSHELLEPFKQKTILVLGDSVDRGSMKYMAENLGLGINIAQWEDANDLEHWKHLDNGADPAYLPHQLWLPQPVDSLITNCFMFGLDDKRDLLDSGADTKVDRAEDRVEKLCKPYTDQLTYPVSAISLQSGLWDLAYFGRRSVASNIATSTPLTQEDLNWWLERMEVLYKAVEKAWPGVPIVMRKMQRASAAGAEARYWHKNQNASKGFQNFFTDVRVHQIRNMQEYFARRHDLVIHDFGLHFEGYQEDYSMDVHPANIPGGVVHNKAFLHYMHRALLSNQRDEEMY